MSINLYHVTIIIEHSVIFLLFRKGERWELQLKGSGKTPYSRYCYSKCLSFTLKN